MRVAGDVELVSKFVEQDTDTDTDTDRRGSALSRAAGTSTMIDRLPAHAGRPDDRTASPPKASRRPVPV